MSEHTSSRPAWEADAECGVKLDCNIPSDALLCTFGGIWGAKSKPGYEFVRTASRLPVKKAYFTDIDQVWYQRGIRSLGTTVDTAVADIRGILEAQNPRRVVMIGNSAGGYAAMLFGMLVGVDEVHAISPQTELLNRRYSYFPEKLSEVHRAALPGPEYLDLREVFLQERVANVQRKTRIYIHYSRLSRIDRYHALRMKGLPNVFLVPYSNPTHGLASLLRDMNILEPLLMNSLSGSKMDVHRIAANARNMFLLSLRQMVEGRARRYGKRFLALK